jgi:hypothetical protein
MYMTHSTYKLIVYFSSLRAAVSQTRLVDKCGLGLYELELVLGLTPTQSKKAKQVTKSSPPIRPTQGTWARSNPRGGGDVGAGIVASHVYAWYASTGRVNSSPYR